MTASDEHPPRDDEPARPEHAGAADVWQDTERALQDARHLQERLRDIATEIAHTENHVAATYRRLAEQALQEGRLADARRLEAEAAAALRAVEREQQEARRRLPPGPGSDHDWTAIEQRTAQARRSREQAAESRDRAARLRDQAARQRDAIAAERDQLAVDRAVAAGHRNDAAARRGQLQEGWTQRRLASAGEGTAEARDEQAEVDAEMTATYRRQAEDDRARTETDRAAEDADREAFRQDRLAAGRDRAAARADREESARDRAAAEADREQDEIDRETTR